HLRHDSREVGRKQGTVWTKDHRVASIVSQNGEATAGHVIDSNNSNGWINRRSRSSGPVLFKPRHTAVALRSQTIVTDVSYTIANTKSHGHGVRKSLVDRICDLSDCAELPILWCWQPMRYEWRCGMLMTRRHENVEQIGAARLS